MIIISSHFVKSDKHIYLPLVDSLEEILKGKNYMVIQHALFQDFQSRFYFSYNKKSFKLIPLPNIFFLRYCLEPIFSARIVLKVISRSELIYFIGINPLNALSGLIIKFFLRDTKVIYYIPDYSPRRFSNFFLNIIYKNIEKFVSGRADYLLCVSKAIYDIKKDRSNVYIFNNYPPKSLVQFQAKHNFKRLCLIGFLNDYYLMDEIFNSIKILSEKANIEGLDLIGGGIMLRKYKILSRHLHISKKIRFFGHLNKNKALKVLSNSGVGLAIYSNNQEYNKYGDSVKIRDYIACGLPVITTDNNSTASEVKMNKLGIVINSKGNISSQIVSAYQEIVKVYRLYSNNCSSYYKKTYKNEEILDSILS